MNKQDFSEECAASGGRVPHGPRTRRILRRMLLDADVPSIRGGRDESRVGRGSQRIRAAGKVDALSAGNRTFYRSGDDSLRLSAGASQLTVSRH